MALSAFTTPSPAVAASFSQTSPHQLLLRGNGNSIPAPISSSPRHLRQRRTNEKAAEGIEEGGDSEGSTKSNDDTGAHTTIPLHPFALQLSNLPSTSPIMEFIHSDGEGGEVGKELPYLPIDALLSSIMTIGTRAFNESSIYGDRFSEWDVGNVWSVASGASVSAGGGDESGGSDNSSGSGSGNGSGNGEGGSGSESMTLPNDDNTVYTTSSRNHGGDRLLLLRALNENPNDLLSNAAVELILGTNGTVTFAGAYWEDDPTSAELTEFLLSVLNSRENLDEFLNLLKPVVCTAEDLIGMTCNVALDAVMSDAPSVVGNGKDDAEKGEGDAAVGAEDGAEDGTEDGEDLFVDIESIVEGTNTDDGSVGNAVIGDLPTNQTEGAGVGTANNANLADPTPQTISMSTPRNNADPENGDDNSPKLQMIIPIAIGASLLVFVIAGLLYRRRRQQRMGATQKLADQEDGLQPNDTTVNQSWTSDAYESITRGSVSPAKDPQQQQQQQQQRQQTRGDSSTVATAGKSVATATRSATAAGAPTASSSANPKEAKIEGILEDLSDGDSSFFSDSSVATSNADDYTKQNRSSVLNGLNGILGESPTPLDDAARANSHLSKGSDKYLPGSLQRPPSSSSSSPNKNVRKPEDFEGTYRTRSAMATMNLKKDILHVACDTHDDGASGNASTAARSGNDPHHDGYIHNIGVTRTISPKKSTSMMEKQRLAEKNLSLRYLGKSSSSTTPNKNKVTGPTSKSDKKQKKKEAREERKSSKDSLFPMGFKRSDSVDLVRKSSGGSSHSDSGSEDAYNGVV